MALAKLKRLATLDDELVQVDSISDEEVLDRQLYYPLLSPKKFAKQFNKIFQPIQLQTDETMYSFQYNHCINPYCHWFGEPQKRYEGIKGKPSRYKMVGHGKGIKPSIKCNLDPEEIGMVQSCSVTPISNLAVSEEIKRLATNNAVKDIEPEYVFHREDSICEETTPFSQPKEFYRRGKSSSNSQKWQCKMCRKITNVLPTRAEKYSYNQKKNVILPSFAKMLVNRMPVSRMCEVLEISPKTYYHKLELLYRRCLEFLEHHEDKPMKKLSLNSVWLNTDKLIYNLNNVRKRGHGGLRYDNTEDKLMQTHIVVSGDVDTNYAFRTDVAYDWEMTMDKLTEDTLLYKEDHLSDFSRKNAHLRFSYAPQPPSKNDTQSEDDWLNERAKIMKRGQYIDGFHTVSSYTVLAHLWLIKQKLNTDKWRFVSDKDDTIMNGFYRVFNEEIKSGKAHHFLCKTDRSKDLQDAYQEYVQGIEELKNWGLVNGLSDKSIRKIARNKLVSELSSHHFHKVLTDGIRNYKVWAQNPIEHPIPTNDKGFYEVDCTTDLSACGNEHIANMILKVSDRPTNTFMQLIRRRLSILERPLVTARGDGKSYIYANFNPKYAQMAVTILRTYYNFCVAMKVKGKKNKLTPAQQLGLTTKQFSLKDIIYFK